MHATGFPECNTIIRPPHGLTEAQVHSIPAYHGKIERGSLEGCDLVVVAWQPSPEDIVRLQAGHPIYLSSVGGLTPHFLCTDFKDAINPA